MFGSTYPWESFTNTRYITKVSEGMRSLIYSFNLMPLIYESYEIEQNLWPPEQIKLMNRKIQE